MRVVDLVTVLAVAMLTACNRAEPVAAEISVAADSTVYREDHLTGASYLVLEPRGSYQLILQEHMGVLAVETGQWSRAGARITFRPSEDAGAGRAYAADVETYREHTYLLMLDEHGAGRKSSVEQARQDIDSAQHGLPPSLFFRVDTQAGANDLQKSYPFKFFPEMNRR